MFVCVVVQVIIYGVVFILMEEFRGVVDGFFFLSQEEKVECVVKFGMCVGYGCFFEMSDGVVNWVDNFILFSYGDEKKFVNLCMFLKFKCFR